ncbi:VWA domain-containing protein [uncultured Selenomonas sp.]|uniref:vWA domain-containing protein n=1 Tax=uncultured Selenomonas sp. TaxID=159275 RepID=UPI0028DB9339|nr:VWA domain-containing protein [uncultured Selenomonas sp.]
MWKKFSSILLTVLLCLACAVASAQAAEDSALRAAAPQEKPSRIELVMILDKSGSMHGLEADTIGGFNAMIEKEKKLGIDVRVTTVLFNDKMDRLYEHREIRSVRPLTERTYETGGTTALLDAVGDTILHMEQSGAADRQGTKVIVVIITDGMENASTEFTKAKVKELISDKQEKAGWDFIYLGANIDAAEEADAIGVRKANAVTYKNTSSGVRANYDAVGVYVAERAGGDKESGAWKDHVEKDETK